MQKILSEKKLVVVLFVMVLVIFSLAQEDTKKIERMYLRAGKGFTSQNQGRLPETKLTENSTVVPAVQLR
jgi:ABC-type proline/glycine betaine transport system ATPase subunit